MTGNLLKPPSPRLVELGLKAKTKWAVTEMIARRAGVKAIN
jgi:hypothetical protein